MALPTRTTTINLHYIRAAIEANTGIRLSLEKTRQYLVEEKLISPQEAKKHAHIFSGYGDFYSTDVSSRNSEDIKDAKELAYQLQTYRWFMKYKAAKTKKANCGASVKAAGGGYMAVNGNGIDVSKIKTPKAGYSKGGTPSKGKKK